MNHPLVSVIIPNYNHAEFLSQRINSVLNQTYQNFELIVLDDKSTDNSIEIIEQYKTNPHFTHIIINTENSGSPFVQWQKGFELAKGEIIWIAESDDTCEKELLDTLIEEFDKDDKCVLAFCKSIKIDTTGNIIGEAGMKTDLHMDGKIFFDKFLYRYCFLNNASSVIFKKKVLNQIDWKYTSFKGSGDWILWIEISRCGNIAYVNKPLNYFRIHGSNTTTLQLHSGRNEIEAIEVYHFMKDKKYIGYFKELRERIAHIYSIKYGKLHKVLTKEVKEKLLSGWRSNIFILFITTLIYHIQSTLKIDIIKR
jgi:glycosyltransferase involved in cell wall biosynthesis